MTQQERIWQCAVCGDCCTITCIKHKYSPTCGCLQNSDIGALWYPISRPAPAAPATDITINAVEELLRSAKKWNQECIAVQSIVVVEEIERIKKLIVSIQKEHDAGVRDAVLDQCQRVIEHCPNRLLCIQNIESLRWR